MKAEAVEDKTFTAFLYLLPAKTNPILLPIKGVAQELKINLIYHPFG
jgi:hypothetical protein